MSPSSYLVMVVYFFLYNMVDQKKTVANQAVADQFKISRSNLHRITSGRKYAGGSIQTGRKCKNLQELEEHRETMVKISKVKAKVKVKKTVTVMKTTPKLIDLPFLDDPPAGGTPWSCKKKVDEDSKPMVH